MILWHIFRSMRPQQWLKNSVIFTAIFLGGQLQDLDKLTTVWGAFIAFCAASSAMYLLNDIIDRKRDQLHPTKKHRPIASGRLSLPLALSSMVVLAAIALYLSWSIAISLLVLILGYMLLQLAYSFVFKQAMIIDAMLIALGFILRVYAGSFIIFEPLSVWLLLAVAAGAWFLALGKRRSELTLMGHRVAAEHRHTLLHYPEILLDSLTTMAATATIVFYSLFTFMNGKQALAQFAQFLPSTLESSKLVMITIPFVLYGVARYLYIIYEKKEADSPEVALLRDWPLMVDLLLLIMVSFIIIYLLPQGIKLG